jgi:hypothetical protein
MSALNDLSIGTYRKSHFSQLVEQKMIVALQKRLNCAMSILLKTAGTPSPII